MTHFFKCTLCALALVLAVPLGTGAASAQDYPTDDVRWIVPFSAGGGTDLVTRTFADALSQKLGHRFFVENKAGGAGGSVGSLELARSTADGSTIGSGTSSGIVNAAINPSDYNPLTDLQPIARMGATTMVLAVSPEIPVSTVDEFVAYAKEHPGMTFGSSGAGSTNHLATEMLATASGTEMTHVPYRGEGAAIPDLMAGHIDLMMMSLASAAPLIADKAVTPLAVTAAERFPNYPDLPTLAESGFSDIVVEAWYGVYVPLETPAEVVSVLVDNVNAARADPEVKAMLLDKLNFSTEGSDTPESFHAYMEAELDRYKTAASAAGLGGN